MSLFRRLHSNSGTSLIEVLVTLGIFVTGMVYILRMFPGGFLSIKHSESVTLANRLAQSELERLEGRAANLPSGIVPWCWDGTQFNIMSTVDPDNMGPQPDMGSYPAGYDPYYFSDVNKFRRVIGETTGIPAPSSTNLNGGSVYVLQFSPILAASFDGKINPDDKVNVYGGNLRRRWIAQGASAPKLKTYGEYAIDYDDAMIYVRPFSGTQPRYYLLTYSYWLSDQGSVTLRPATGIRIKVDPVAPSQVNSGNIEIRIPAPGGGYLNAVQGFEGIDRVSDTFAREFVRIAQSGAWDPTDPYEFKLVDPVSGVLAFNPAGYGYEEYTARGKTTLTANIDYTILDWHIIHEERTVPSHINGTDYTGTPADLDAKLTLRFLKKTDESDSAPGIPYTGLAPNYGMPFDVMAVDVETGDIYVNSPNQAYPDYHYFIPGTSPVRRAMEVNYKDGIIRFDPDFAALKQSDATAQSPFAGKSFRIYYRAEGDWAIQTYKAYDVMQRSYSPSLDQRQFYLDGSNVYFQKCCAGTTMAVDFAYQVAGNPQEVFASGQVFDVSTSTGAYNLCSLDLTSKLSASYPPGTQFVITRISRVYGVSMGVRVVWRESGRGFTSGRWRKVGLETYLTRPGS